MSRKFRWVHCGLLFILGTLLVMPAVYAQDQETDETLLLRAKMQNIPLEDLLAQQADEALAAEKALVNNHVMDYGMVAVLQGYVRMINLRTLSLSPPLLQGRLGNASGGLLDVMFTPNLRYALVSNFGDQRINIIDVTNPVAPFLRQHVRVNLFAEDIDVTPDSKYALVTDGGFSSAIAVIDIAAGRVRQTYDLGSRDAQSVAVAADGQTVLCADYWGGAVHVLTLNPWTGQLRYKSTIDVMPYWPVNIAISPDGRTALVCNAFGPGDDKIATEGSSLPVLRIDKGSRVTWTETIHLPPDFSNAQSAVFTSDGWRAFFIVDQNVCNGAKSDEHCYFNEIHVLDVLGPGDVRPTGDVIPVPFYSNGSYFGVDTLAIDPYNRYLFVSNKTSSGNNDLAIISLYSLRQIKTLHPGVGEDDLPTGVAFPTNRIAIR
ncbi:MAG: hypothetical protein JXQ27_04430 [Acidobacteria bacterium]|nr:hypothetical protein [Acidobacteriota bacterium]